MVEVPRAAEAPTVNVKVEVPEPVTEVVENDAVTPVGKPLTDSPTALVNPFTAPIVTVDVGAPPRAAVIDEGDGVIVKSGGGVTVRVTVAEWTSVPLVPFTLIV
jgi:hypothetical protein